MIIDHCVIGFIALLPHQSAMLACRDRKGKRRISFSKEHQVIDRRTTPADAQVAQDDTKVLKP